MKFKKRNTFTQMFYEETDLEEKIKKLKKELKK